MLLFIFESIGTPELFLIGLIALIFLGPRKLPDLARKAGKISSELKKASGEFRETWQREVEDEMKDFKDLAKLEDDASRSLVEPVARETKAIEPPTVKTIDEPTEIAAEKPAEPVNVMPETQIPTTAAEKENWF